MSFSIVAKRTAAEWREIFRNDFYAFCKGCLEFYELEEDPHAYFCRDIQRAVLFPGPTENLWLVPRGFFKTTIGVIGLSLWLLVRDPNATILISTSKLDLAESRLLAIQAIIEGAPKFVRTFGQVGYKKGFPWTARSMRIAKRSNLTSKDDSIIIGSVDSTNIGIHVQYQINDDLVDDQNSKTENGREDVRRYYRLLRPMGIPGRTKRFTFGTPWHRGDLYDSLIRGNSKISIVKRSCYEKYQTSPEGQSIPGLIFPKRITQEHLNEEAQNMTIAEFSAQYECSYLDETSKVLRLEWLRMIDGNFEFLAKGIGRVSWIDKMTGFKLEELVRPRLTIDPSLGKKGNDAIGLALVGWARDSMKFLIASWRVFGGIAYVAERIAWICKTYGIYDIGAEVNGWGAFLVQAYEQAMLQDGLMGYTVHKIMSKGEKTSRIESLMQPHCRAGELFVFNGENKDFIKEYEMFPQSDEFNVIDAVSFTWNMPGCRPPTDKDLERESLPTLGFYDIPPSQRADWLAQQMGRRRQPSGSIFTGW